MSKEKLVNELNKLDGRKMVLFVCSPEKLQEEAINIVELLVKDKKIPGLYVSLNKPYKIIREILKSRKIEDKLSFVDTMASKREKYKEEEGVLILSNPADLTAIAVSIGAFSKQTNSKKFLIIDALSTLLIYNNLEGVAKFIQSLSCLSSIGENFLMVFITSECKDENFIQKITPFLIRLLKYNGLFWSFYYVI